MRKVDYSQLHPQARQDFLARLSVDFFYVGPQHFMASDHFVERLL